MTMDRPEREGKRRRVGGRTEREALENVEGAWVVARWRPRPPIRASDRWDWRRDVTMSMWVDWQVLRRGAEARSM